MTVPLSSFPSFPSTCFVSRPVSQPVRTPPCVDQPSQTTDQKCNLLQPPSTIHSSLVIVVVSLALLHAILSQGEHSPKLVDDTTEEDQPRFMAKFVVWLTEDETNQAGGRGKTKLRERRMWYRGVRERVLERREGEEGY